MSCVYLKTGVTYCELSCNFNTWLYKLTSFSIYHLIILFQIKFTLVYHFILSEPILEKDNISQFCWWAAFVSTVMYSQFTSISLCPLSSFKYRYILFLIPNYFICEKKIVSHSIHKITTCILMITESQSFWNRKFKRLKMLYEIFSLWSILQNKLFFSFFK